LFSARAEGIGLCLALTPTRAAGHKGSIRVQSEPGKGSSSIVRLGDTTKFSRKILPQKSLDSRRGKQQDDPSSIEP